MWPTLVGARPVVPDASSRAPRTAVPEPARHFDLLAVVGRPSGRTDVGIGRHPATTAVHQHPLRLARLLAGASPACVGDRKSVGEGMSGSVRVDLGGGGSFKKKNIVNK